MHNVKVEDCDVDSLIGVDANMSDASIGGSLIQSYLHHILACMLDKRHLQLSVISFQLVEVILEQGLVHPILVLANLGLYNTKCVPSLVAIQNHEDKQVRLRARHIHETLYKKHASFMNAKNLECIQSAYNYQILSTTQDSSGCRYSENEGFESILSHMYSVIQTSGIKCHEFLTTMVKTFTIDDKSMNSMVFHVKLLLQKGSLLFIIHC